MLALISFIRRSEEDGGGANDDDEYTGNHVTMFKAGPGFTLPANIGDLNPAITELNLLWCSLTGMNFGAQCRFIALEELLSAAVELIPHIYHGIHLLLMVSLQGRFLRAWGNSQA